MSTAMRNRVLSVLGSLPRGFGFTDAVERTYEVTPTSLQRVANAVRQGRVTVVALTSATADGQYDPNNRRNGNQLRFRTSYPTATRYYSVIVHEAVHCLQDIVRARFSRPLEEVAANVAENMFRRLWLGRGGGRVSPPPGDIDAAADRVAQRLLGISDIRRRVLRMSDPDVAALARTIRRSSAYSRLIGMTITGNGV